MLPLRLSRPTALWTLIWMLVLCVALASGCVNTRTVLVNQDSPIRVGPNVRGRVYTCVRGVWVLGDEEVRIPEGYYLVPPSYVRPDDSISSHSPPAAGQHPPSPGPHYEDR